MQTTGMGNYYSYLILPGSCCCCFWERQNKGMEGTGESWYMYSPTQDLAKTNHLFENKQTITSEISRKTVNIKNVYFPIKKI